MEKNSIVVALESGHRRHTPGKQSPDGLFKEWEWNEDCKNVVLETLIHQGFNVVDVTPKGDDDSLAQRVKAVNTLCKQHGKANVLYISIHANAAGNGQWMNARRWSIWTSPGQTQSDALAEKIYEAAKAKWGEKALRSDLTDGDHDYEKAFYVLVNSMCPAVLVENFFYDNKDDLEYLLSPQSIYDCAEVIVSGLHQYLQSK